MAIQYEDPRNITTLIHGTYTQEMKLYLLNAWFIYCGKKMEIRKFGIIFNGEVR